MANTWHVNTFSALTTGVPFGAAKHMFDIFNSSSSARYIRVYRIWTFNTSATTVTGVLTQLQIKFINTNSGGSTLTPIPHVSSNSSLDANTTCGYGRVCSSPTDNLLRQYLWSNVNTTISSQKLTMVQQNLECMVPFALAWDLGYGDSTIKPITLRASNNEGVSVYHPGLSTVGFLDIEAEFTDSAS